MKSLIVGNGEVGKGLYKVLKPYYDIFTKDIEDINVGKIDIMHICFPFSDKFVKECRRLEKLYKPKYIVIHSTVPVGTTRKLGKKYSFSPIRGRHPHLAEGINVFTKYIAGNNLKVIEEYFKKAMIVVKRFKNTDSLEFAKIMCTTRYGVDIVFMKLMAEYCKKKGYEFDEVYTEWTNSYNAGYEFLNEKKFWRPVLDNIKGKIGGHCVVNNCQFIDNWATRIIKYNNK